MHPDPSDRTTAAVAAQLVAEGRMPEDVFVETIIVVVAWRGPDGEGIAYCPSLGADTTRQADMLRQVQDMMEARPH